MGIRRLQAVIQAGPYTMGMHGMGHEGSAARGPPNAMGGGGGGVQGRMSAQQHRMQWYRMQGALGCAVMQVMQVT
jgi:hypothetical protein